MTLRNCCSASSMPAAVQRRHMSPFCQCLTLRLTRRTVSIIDSHGFVDASVRLCRPQMPRRVTVSVSSKPSRSEAAAPGWLADAALHQRAGADHVADGLAERLGALEHALLDPGRAR